MVRLSEKISILVTHIYLDLSSSSSMALSYILDFCLLVSGEQQDREQQYEQQIKEQRDSIEEVT